SDTAVNVFRYATSSTLNAPPPLATFGPLSQTFDLLLSMYHCDNRHRNVGHTLHVDNIGNR
ncbi:hypothetical protein LIY48_26245, partial [Escherichia coli]|nr:hypothetical protein [Escherichia coli]